MGLRQAQRGGAVIQITLVVDVDEPTMKTCDRHTEAIAPPGYAVEIRCIQWHRELESGAVALSYHMTIKSPAGILPRIPR